MRHQKKIHFLQARLQFYCMTCCTPLVKGLSLMLFDFSSKGSPFCVLCFLDVCLLFGLPFLFFPSLVPLSDVFSLFYFIVQHEHS